MSGRGPVFVIGPERSGINLLAWSLGQHPRMRTVLSTRWLGRLTSDLRDAYGEATRDDRCELGSRAIRPEVFYEVFGQAALRLVNGEATGGRPARVVSAAAEHAFDVAALRWLFPDARFICVIRDVSSVVRLLRDQQVSKAFRTNYREQKAYEHWLSTVRACLAAERAFGSEAVLRVLHGDLTTEPEATLRRCLEFLDEEWHPACIRPLHGVSAELDADPETSDEATDGPHKSVPFRSEAETLSHALLSGPCPTYGPDPDLIVELERAAWPAGQGVATVPLAERVRGAMEAVMPAGSSALVVSRGDEALLHVNGRSAAHFPQGEDGVYLGYHPADSREAITRLEALRARGAQFLVLPATSSWWLEHYAEFREHLDLHYPLVAHREDVCVIYSLDPQSRVGLDLRDRSAPPAARSEPDDPADLLRRVESLEAELVHLRSQRTVQLAANGGRSG